MKHRLALILPAHFVAFGLCYYLAYLLRFDFHLPAQIVNLFWLSLPVLLLVKGVACLLTGEWRRTYRYATVADVGSFAITALLGSGLLFEVNTFVRNDTTLLDAISNQSIPRSVILIDCVLCVLALAALRVGARIWGETIKSQFQGKGKEKAIVFGSGRSALAILRALQTSNRKYKVVGFLDEPGAERNRLLAGLPVCSAHSGLGQVSQRLRAKHLLIPGNISGRRVRELHDECTHAGVQSHIIPSVDQLLAGRYKLKVQEVTINDLLRREPAVLDKESIQGYISGKVVLVTGGAGSIGSELCRQILAFHPDTLIVLDQSEFGTFQIEQELGSDDSSPTSLHFVIGDVRDQKSLRKVFEQYRPELVFHAAAYKHVPLMEQHPREALRTNVLGTRNVADLANEFGVARFVLISTDKAVRPTSIMGASKLVAEKYVQALADDSTTAFATVRFGNVLNSAGSVVPTFRRQIENGGPVTVTHPDMQRYFMTIPEAVELVLQAGALGASGDLMILEMGEPVRIVDLAKDMISLSGLRYPDDVDIVFTGVRPGEKLYEELFYGEELKASRVHDKIFCARCEPVSFNEMSWDLRRLEASLTGTNEDARNELKRIVDQFVEADTPLTAELKSAA